MMSVEPSQPTSPALVRPVVYSYESPHLFFKDLLVYYKSAGTRFSLRQRVQKHPGCSVALISQILSGKRRLTRNQLPLLSVIFKLSQPEQDFLDQFYRPSLTPAIQKQESPAKIK